MSNTPRIKNGKQRFACFVGYFSVLLMAAVLFAPIIPEGSHYVSAFDHLLELNFGGNQMRDLGAGEIATFVDLSMIAVLIFTIIMVPINVKYLRQRLPKNKKKFGFESDEDYTKRLLHFENELYFRNLYGTNIIACLRWCVSPLCFYTFIVLFFSLIAENAQGNMSGNIRPIIAGIIFLICTLGPENLFLAKEQKQIVEDNMIFDTNQLMLRERTSDELENQKNALYRALEEQTASKTNKSENQTAQSAITSNNDSTATHAEKDNIQLLKEYKYLLDSGIISQEEFDAKKKELLKSPKDK